MPKAVTLRECSSMLMKAATLASWFSGLSKVSESGSTSAVSEENKGWDKKEISPKT